MSHAYARPLPGGRRAGASTVQLLVAAAEAGEAEMVPRRKECFALERSLLRLVAALTKEDLSGADASAVHAAALSLVSAKSAFSQNAAGDLIALASVACLVEQALRVCGTSGRPVVQELRVVVGGTAVVLAEPGDVTQLTLIVEKTQRAIANIRDNLDRQSAGRVHMQAARVAQAEVLAKIAGLHAEIVET